MAKGKFIVFEGLDGAGTTTQIDLLSGYLKKQGYKVFVTKEPTNNIIGGLIKGQLTKQWRASPGCLQLLFAADRSNHLTTEIIPALEKGAVVLCDRYVLSSIAFGGINLDIKWLKDINSKFPNPDFTIFLDTSPKECIERMKKNRLSLELFEEKNKLMKVRKLYLEMIDNHRGLTIIDGNKPITSIFNKIKNTVEKIL